ncbi:MAG: hypothetical protein R3C05_15655 [Pirellulaceae bacterium]
MQTEKQRSDSAVGRKSEARIGQVADEAMLNDVVQAIICDAQHSSSEYLRGANTHQQGE